MAVLLITRPLPDAIARRAAADFTARPFDLTTPIPPADALLCAPTDKIDRDLVARLPPGLRVIGTFSAGFDHIDLAACAARGIAVVNTPDVLSDATAEFTLLLLLAAARRAAEGDRLIRAGDWQGWAPDAMMGIGVSGKKLGIFGMGRIGRALARMARGLGMAIHYHNRAQLPDTLEEGATYHAQAGDFLPQCQFLALCAPGGAATFQWLNADRLARLPRGAVVVNSARGSLIDDTALVASLRRGHVAAAGLDVFVGEPTVPAAYLTLPNVVLTPHLGSATRETREAMGHLVLDGITAILRGERPRNLIGAP